MGKGVGLIVAGEVPELGLQINEMKAGSCSIDKSFNETCPLTTTQPRSVRIFTVACPFRKGRLSSSIRSVIVELSPDFLL
jgi:hypothetical protein